MYTTIIIQSKNNQILHQIQIKKHVKKFIQIHIFIIKTKKYNCHTHQLEKKLKIMVINFHILMEYSIIYKK